VADYNNHRILGFNLSGGITNGMNATWRFGQSNFTNKEYFSGQSRCPYVTALAYDSVNQRLFAADNIMSRVKVYDFTTITNNENAVNVLGQTCYSSGCQNHLTTQSGMIYPRGLAYDSPNQRVCVADTDNQRVMVYDVASITNGENAINVLGQPDYVSSAYATTQAGMLTTLQYSLTKRNRM
jgi:DNA-binding beta-propeller fold protein YncE